MANYKKGDVNMDGIINEEDYNLVSNASIGAATLTDEQKALADLDGDGEITSFDAYQISVLMTEEKNRLSKVYGFKENGARIEVPTKEDLNNLDIEINVIDNLTSNSATDPLSANQGKVLNDKINNLNIPAATTVVDNLTSNSATAALSANQGRVLNEKIDNLDIPDAVTVVDNVSSTSTTSALSANQGKILNDKIGVLTPDSSARAHNLIYRGNDITEYWNSGQMSIDIANGDFSNIYPGDYIIKTKTINGTTFTNHKDVIAECDPYYGRELNPKGDMYPHHVGIIPATVLGSTQINTEDNISSGFSSTLLKTTAIPACVTGYEAAYGTRFLNPYISISSATNTTLVKPDGNTGGSVSSPTTSWYTKGIPLTETQVFGCPYHAFVGVDTAEGYRQLAIFKLDPNFAAIGTGWWLRGIASTSSLCAVYTEGEPWSGRASLSFGIRPMFLLR